LDRLDDPGCALRLGVGLEPTAHELRSAGGPQQRLRGHAAELRDGDDVLDLAHVLGRSTGLGWYPCRQCASRIEYRHTGCRTSWWQGSGLDDQCCQAEIASTASSIVFESWIWVIAVVDGVIGKAFAMIQFFGLASEEIIVALRRLLCHPGCHNESDQQQRHPDRDVQ